MDTLHVTLDLAATPWTDMRGDEWPTGVITRVGLARGYLAPGDRSVAVVVTLANGSRVVGLVDLDAAIDAVKYLARSKVLQHDRCDRCGHHELVHVLNRKGIRATCTHGDGSGFCDCNRYVPIVSSIET